mgnify:CR=1 FL=1
MLAEPTRLGIRVVAAAAATLLLAAPAAAQEGSGEATSDSAAARDTAAATADSAEALEYRREVFTYPGAGRRSPFRAPDAGEGMGPQFEDLSLSGIIHAPSIGSVAIVKDGATGERHRLREGQRIGDARVVEIRREDVVFSVSGITGPRREVLQAQTEEQEGN